MKNKVLGRGLEALIPMPEEEGVGVQEIELAGIKSNPYQPRQQFDREGFEELKRSIEEKGIIQPIAVRKAGDGFEVIAGERRVRACKELGWEKIAAYALENISDGEMLEIALVENIQREDLNPMELALAYQRLITERHLTQEEVAQRVGKDRSTVTNFLRLLKLPAKVQESLRTGEITVGHARALVTVGGETNQLAIWEKIVRQGLNVRQVEKLVGGGTLRPPGAGPSRPKKLSYLIEAEDKLQGILGTKVRIKHRKKGGHIEIEYYSNEDLERLMEIFSAMEERY
ncbi:ParB/RepB/Spo0J family partition protein [candidate division KSB1 bacterium]|nr:ParB/RepB/Spo0J family partition protein [candidate division KSB1 bacterium]